MRKVMILLLLLPVVVFPVSAAELTAPTVPRSGQALMPEDTESFAQGLWSIVKDAIALLSPELAEGMRLCVSVFCVCLVVSIFRAMPSVKEGSAVLAAAALLGGLLLGAADSMIRLAADTVTQISEYSKLLMAVMAGTLAAQGAVSTSGALYTLTALFAAVILWLTAKVLIPMVYIALGLGLACAAVEETLLRQLLDLIKKLTVWSLKSLLSVYAGFLAVTGAVSGNVDAAALKAAKAAFRGMVPVVGGILSDASETVLAGFGTVKAAAGVYGLLAVAAVTAVPFFRIGLQYLLLKLTAAVCSVFSGKRVTDLIGEFSWAMGLLLGMTGVCCLGTVLGVVCFMKGAL